jgi:hypothetical protein
MSVEFNHHPKLQMWSRFAIGVVAIAIVVICTAQAIGATPTTTTIRTTAAVTATDMVPRLASRSVAVAVIGAVAVIITVDVAIGRSF